ncbi:MAG: hypothetical protein MZV64_44880 [Ignavibacteriales bacterium]|nr:hypothetical protein [Ignavibacteriales bacterium]
MQRYGALLDAALPRRARILNRGDMMTFHEQLARATARRPRLPAGRAGDPALRWPAT